MITPNIIKETCEGTACIPIHDALFRRREIFCTDCYFSASEAVAWGLADSIIDQF